MSAVAPSDYRDMARRRLPRFLFDYLDGGSGVERTLARNMTDLAAVELRQAVLTGCERVDTGIELLGRRWRMPVALGPVGLAGIYARRGEVQAAQAAAMAGIPFCLSTVSVCPIEEVARAAADFWFQLYLLRDRSIMKELLARAQQEGCTTLVFTVDMPVPGIRYRDRRSGLAGAPGLVGALRRAGQAIRRPGWAWDVGLMGRPHHLGNIAPFLKGRTGLEDFFGWMAGNFDASVTWAELEEVRSLWPGPLVVKGILDPGDARQAAALGADAIVVSNHGGRQLDGASSTARALPAIADAVGDQLAVLVDGGVRDGSDVVRMLALGAKGVLLGRAWVYALAAGGRATVGELLAMMQKELEVAMTLTGNSSISSIGRNTLAPFGKAGG